MTSENAVVDVMQAAIAMIELAGLPLDPGTITWVTPSAAAMLDLRDYRHLRGGYIARREGACVAVPLGDLSRADLTEVITRYNDLGAACIRHADELRTFKNARRAALRDIRKARRVSRRWKRREEPVS